MHARAHRPTCTHRQRYANSHTHTEISIVHTNLQTHVAVVVVLSASITDDISDHIDYVVRCRAANTKIPSILWIT